MVQPFGRLSVTVKSEELGALSLARSRIVIVRTFFIVLYAVIGIRLFDVMVLQGDFWRASPVSESVVTSSMSPSFGNETIRSDIVDRNGVLLATSLKVYSLYADPKYIVNASDSALALTKIFPKTSYETFLKKLQKGGRFVWLYRGLTPEDQSRVLRIGEPGLGFRPEYKRVYPQGNALAHFVGYSGVDGSGLMGIEKEFHSFLSEGKSPLRLSVDVRLQHALSSEVSRYMDRFSAKGAAGVVMDVHDGDVVAMVSLPDFDPHNPMSGDGSGRFNRVTQGVYELGSVFKIFSIAAFLDRNDRAISRTFDATQPLKSGRYKIRDFHPENRVLSVPEIFKVSSNIGTALIAQEMGRDVLVSFYKSLGLMDVLNVSFPGLGRPIVPRPWREINTLTASYGHGIAVSPLHLSGAVASIVNGGTKISPRFVLSDKGRGRPVGVRVVSEKTSKTMRGLMEMVVTEGTAKKAQVSGVLVGGKTGTAEKPGKNGYDRKKLISSFVGAFPINDPQYVVFVMLDEPKGIKESYGYATAGWTAAPIFSDVVKRMVAILSFSLDDIKSKDKKEKRSVSNVSYNQKEVR